MANDERLRELEEKYEGFTVYDNSGSKIGKVDDLFVDETDNEEYIGVKMGFFGSKSTLIPTEIVRVNENDRTIEVSESKDHVKDAPSFSDDDDVTSAYEERIRSHFGLESLGSSSGRGSYGGTSGGTSGGATSGAAAGATSGTSDRDDHESSDRGSSTTGDGDHESSGQDTYDPSTGVATGGSGTGAGEHQGSGESSSSDEHRAEGGSEGTGTQYGDMTSSGSATTGGSSTTEGSSTSSTTGGSSGSKPTTTRQTEETETFQEGGRTKIRRRIIREEVTDADDQSASS